MADPSLEIGKHIRSRRAALVMTLDDLANASGVSSTMLSEIERGLKNPTVRLAYQVARALNCTLSDLLDEERESFVSIVRAADRNFLVDPETGLERHVLSHEFLRRGLEILWYRLPPGKSTGEMTPNRPGVLESLTVLSGELTFAINGETLHLHPRDSATYGPSTVEYRNESSDACDYLIVIDSSRAVGEPGADPAG